MRRYTRGGGVASGTSRKAPDPKPHAFRFPPKTVFTDTEYDLLFFQVKDWAIAGLYMLLRGLADFETGEVIGVLNHDALMATGIPPKPQQGPRRPGPTYEQTRRMLRELEYWDLVTRGTRNKALGQLHLYLPHVSANAEAYRKKLLAQRKRAQESAQAPKGRKAA